MRHDRAQVGGRVRQRLPRCFALADVVGNADENRLAAMGRAG